MICVKCNKKLSDEAMATAASGGYETLVSYHSPPGHNHDDNCLVQAYICNHCGHVHRISKRRTCPVCDWKGKLTCFCHDGNKVDEWPT